MTDSEHADRCDSSCETHGVITYTQRTPEQADIARQRQAARLRATAITRVRVQQERKRTR